MSLPSKCACLAPLLIPAVPVQASPLGAPHILGLTQITRTGEAVDTVGFGTIDIVNAAFGGAELTMSGDPIPLIMATAIGAPDPINNSVVRAVGQIEFFMSVAGPDGQVPVLVTVSGNAHATTDLGSFYALESSWSLVGEVVNVGDLIRTGQGAGSFDQGFGGTLGVLLTTNRVYSVTMRADASIAVTDNSTGVGFASIDPTFALGLGADPQLYSFEFSPGIGNTPAAGEPVPEPASMVLLGTALAARDPPGGASTT